METLEEFYDLIKQSESQKISYSVLFDRDTGRIIGVGPTSSFKNRTNILEIDSELAIGMLNSSVKMASYYVDFENDKLELTKNTSLTKIDNVLHRIIQKEFSDVDDIDLCVTCDITNEKIIFELSTQLGGSKDTGQEKIAKKLRWEGHTLMDFYLTDYNDPNIIFKVFTLSIYDLLDKSLEYNDVVFPKNFSIFTRRLFKNYVLEIV